MSISKNQEDGSYGPLPLAGQGDDQKVSLATAGTIKCHTGMQVGSISAGLGTSLVSDQNIASAHVAANIAIRSQMGDNARLANGPFGNIEMGAAAANTHKQRRWAALSTRCGKIKIARKCLHDYPDIIMRMMGQCLVLRCELHAADDMFVYDILSPQLPEAEEGSPFSEYDVEINDAGGTKFVRSEAAAVKKRMLGPQESQYDGEQSSAY